MIGFELFKYSSILLPITLYPCTAPFLMALLHPFVVIFILNFSSTVIFFTYNFTVRLQVMLLSIRNVFEIKLIELICEFLIPYWEMFIVSLFNNLLIWFYFMKLSCICVLFISPMVGFEFFEMSFYVSRHFFERK